MIFSELHSLCETGRTDCQCSPYRENENEPITKVAVPVFALRLIGKIADTASDKYAIPNSSHKAGFRIRIRISFIPYLTCQEDT